MDWKAEALARVRRTRQHANRLHHEIDDAKYALDKLGDYNDECVVLTDIAYVFSDIIIALFAIEGKLSRLA